MTDAAHHGTTMNAGELFPAREWDAFKETDRQAAKAIVVLMTGIFCIGVVLYSIVFMTL
jgi:hypothetical protein